MRNDKRAVLVEHDQSLLALYRATLKLARYDVVGMANDAATAMSMVRVEKPDVLLVDFRISGCLNGLDLIAKVREADPRIFTVLVTAVCLSELVAEIEKAKPHRTLQKPFMIRSLLEVLPDRQPRAIFKTGTL